MKNVQDSEVQHYLAKGASGGLCPSWFSLNVATAYLI